MKGAILAMIATLTIHQLASQPGVEAVTCGQVDSTLMPCVGYLTRGAGPSPACSDGVRAVKGLAQTTADKRTCFGCVKAAAIHYVDLKDEAAQNLPTKCSVRLDIPISRPVDCNKLSGVTSERSSDVSPGSVLVQGRGQGLRDGSSRGSKVRVCYKSWSEPGVSTITSRLLVFPLCVLSMIFSCMWVLA